MKYCPDCGRKIEDTVKICPYCLCNMEEAGFDKNIPDENTGGNNSRTGRPFSWEDSDSNTSDQQISWDSSDNTASDPTYTADPYHTGSPEDTTADPYTNHAPFASNDAAATDGYESDPDVGAAPASDSYDADPDGGYDPDPDDDYDYDDDAPEGAPVGPLDRIRAAVEGFFGDGPENRSFIVVGVALLAAVLIVGGILAHGLFGKKTGTAGPGEVASNAGVTTTSTGEETGSKTGTDNDSKTGSDKSSETGSKTGTDSSSKTGKDNTDNVIDTTPTDEMKKRQEEAEKRKAEREAAEKAQRAEEAKKKAEEERKAAEKARQEAEAKKKAEEEKKAAEAKKAEEEKKAEEKEASEKAKEEAAKERHKEEEERRKAEEAKKKAEEEKQKKAEEEKQKQDQEEQQKTEETSMTALEAFAPLYEGKSFLYGQQYTAYLTDPSQSYAGVTGLDATEVPEGDFAYYVYDFDDDGTEELLMLELTQECTILAKMYEFDGDSAKEEDRKLIEIDNKENGRKTVCRMIGGAPAFANAFVYRVDDSIRIGFEFAYAAVGANGIEHDILSYTYEGNALELRDYYGNAGSTIDMDVSYDRNLYKEMYEAFVRLGAGAMSTDDIASMWNMQTHFVDYMKDVREIYRVDSPLISDNFDYAKWENGGRQRTEYSAIVFADQQNLFTGNGSKYREPVPFPEEEDANGGTGRQDQGTQTEDGQYKDDRYEDDRYEDSRDNEIPEDTGDQAYDGTSEDQNKDTGNESADDTADDDLDDGSESADLRFLVGVWERVGSEEGVMKPMIIFDGNTAYYFLDEPDHDDEIVEAVKTDYGYFLRMANGTDQYGFRWEEAAPNYLYHVDTWDVNDMSTYSEFDSYAKTE